MPFTSRFGDLFTVPWNENPGPDVQQVVTAAASSGTITTTLYTVPANTLAVLRHTSLLVNASTSLNQILYYVAVKRGAVTTIIVRGDSQATGILNKEADTTIVLQPGDLIQTVYNNADTIAHVVQAYCIVDTFNL